MKGLCAALTRTFNEPDFLGLWYDYYSRFFDKRDIYILNDGSDSEFIDDFRTKANVIDVSQIGHCYRGDAKLRQNALRWTGELLDKYRFVLHADNDEFVIPDPELWPDGLIQFISSLKEPFAQCTGRNVLQSDDEAPIDWSKRPILQQRSEWHRDWQHYCKVAIVAEDPKWGGGCHASKWTANKMPQDKYGDHERRDLFMVHLHYIDIETLRRRYHFRRVHEEYDLFNERNAESTVKSFYNREDCVREAIPERIKLIL